MSNYANLQTGPQPIYHLCYRTILCTVDERYDIRGYVLAEMVGACLKHRATLSVEQRAYFARYAQPDALAYLERLTANCCLAPRDAFRPRNIATHRRRTLNQTVPSVRTGEHALLGALVTFHE